MCVRASCALADLARGLSIAPYPVSTASFFFCMLLEKKRHAKKTQAGSGGQSKHTLAFFAYTTKWHSKVV